MRIPRLSPGGSPYDRSAKAETSAGRPPNHGEPRLSHGEPRLSHGEPREDAAKPESSRSGGAEGGGSAAEGSAGIPGTTGGSYVQRMVAQTAMRRLKARQ
eukprot:1088766-Prorocentrum_minimum.AAC.1